MEYWLINSSRTEVKRFIKNNKSIEGVFEYIFIDSGKIISTLGKETLFITNREELKKNPHREEWGKLIAHG